MVPVSSIPEFAPPLIVRSVDPLDSVTLPLTGKAVADDGVCQKLVEVLTVPSARMSRCAVSRVPSASEPPVHGSVVVFDTWNVQLPVASA
jgi:hypothetical protein